MHTWHSSKQCVAGTPPISAYIALQGNSPKLSHGVETNEGNYMVRVCVCVCVCVCFKGTLQDRGFPVWFPFKAHQKRTNSKKLLSFLFFFFFRFPSKTLKRQNKSAGCPQKADRRICFCRLLLRLRFRFFPRGHGRGGLARRDEDGLPHHGRGQATASATNISSKGMFFLGRIVFRTGIPTEGE